MQLKSLWTLNPRMKKVLASDDYALLPREYHRPSVGQGDDETYPDTTINFDLLSEK